jgi:hypothetical protein
MAWRLGLVLALLVGLAPMPTDAQAPELFLEWFAFDPEDAGGVNVAFCFPWVITARATGAPPRVRAWVLDLSGPIFVREWDAYDPRFGGGVAVSCGIFQGSAIVTTTPGITGGPHVRVWVLGPPPGASP